MQTSTAFFRNSQWKKASDTDVGVAGEEGQRKSRKMANSST